MSPVMLDRRAGFRMSAAYPVSLYDRRGRLLMRGRTVNISENGVFVITQLRLDLPATRGVRVEVMVPSHGDNGRRPESRKVLYSCRVVRTQSIGQLVGLGIKFLRKLA